MFKCLFQRMKRHAYAADIRRIVSADQLHRASLPQLRRSMNFAVVGTASGPERRKSLSACMSANERKADLFCSYCVLSFVTQSGLRRLMTSAVSAPHRSFLQIGG